MKLGSREVQMRKILVIGALGVAGFCGLPACGTAAQAAVATAGPHTVHVSARLTVTYTAPAACKAGVCVIRNRGTGTLSPYGRVSFTTVITADGNQPPCGATSQWVNRIIRTITTSQGALVLHEAGLQCPQPGTGPQVRAVWAADGAVSTGIFHGARGQGPDTAYPALNTAAPQGTLTLSP
jgi:hypothetical protein